MSNFKHESFLEKIVQSAKTIKEHVKTGIYIAGGTLLVEGLLLLGNPAFAQDKTPMNTSKKPAPALMDKQTVITADGCTVSTSSYHKFCKPVPGVPAGTYTIVKRVDAWDDTDEYHLYKVYNNNGECIATLKYYPHINHPEWSFGTLWSPLKDERGKTRISIGGGTGKLELYEERYSKPNKGIDKYVETFNFKDFEQNLYKKIYPSKNGKPMCYKKFDVSGENKGFEEQIYLRDMDDILKGIVLNFCKEKGIKSPIIIAGMEWENCYWHGLFFYPFEQYGTVYVNDEPICRYQRHKAYPKSEEYDRCGMGKYSLLKK